MNLVCNEAYGCCRDGYLVYLFDMGGYIPVAHPKTIHREDLLFDLVTEGCLMFFHDLGFESAVTVSGSFQFKGTVAGTFDGFFIHTVASVLPTGEYIIGNMGFNLSFKCRFGKLFDKRS